MAKKTPAAPKAAPDFSAQIAEITQQRDQAITIANYTASIILKQEAAMQNSLLKLANVDTPAKINFWWVLRNWRVIAELLESIWNLIKEFRQNIKFNEEPNT